MNNKTNTSLFNRLSTRECQVLKLVAEGHTSQEIARIVGVKPSSVYTYRSRIMSKLESKNVAALVRFAIRHRLIKP
jgi:DNA-binding CsgD family transcriptional regulator